MKVKELSEQSQRFRSVRRQRRMGMLKYIHDY